MNTNKLSGQPDEMQFNGMGFYAGGAALLLAV